LGSSRSAGHRPSVPASPWDWPRPPGPTAWGEPQVMGQEQGAAGRLRETQETRPREPKPGGAGRGGLWLVGRGSSPRGSAGVRKGGARLPLAPVVVGGSGLARLDSGRDGRPELGWLPMGLGLTPQRMLRADCCPPSTSHRCKFCQQSR
jgi:hypothetical protein